MTIDVPAAVRAAAQAAVDEVRETRPEGVSWSSVEVAEAIMGARSMEAQHVRFMATHPYDPSSVSARLLGGDVGRAWARDYIVADQRDQIDALVAAAVANGLASAPLPRLKKLSERLAKVDQKFRSQVEAVLSQAMRKAERHARTKAQVKARRLTKSQLASIAPDLDAGRLTSAVCAALSVTDEELLQAQFHDAADHVTDLFRERQRARRKALAQAFADEGLTEDDLDTEWEASDNQRAEALAAFVAVTMFMEARARLNSGASGTDLYDPRGEIPFDTAVPGNIVTAIVKVADGATVSSNGSVVTAPAAGPDTAVHPLADRHDDLVADVIARYTVEPTDGGQSLAEVMAENAAEGGGETPELPDLGSPVPVQYVWQVGTPQHPFEPHQDLAGVVFGPDDYWDVIGKDPNEWPYGTYAWTPGDHPGCQCWLDIIWGASGS